ncbi:hypothetical protein AB0G02_35745, partial [Actinosynnema sp. NPDC023658]|uniref:hypothetical protein n=1 Tax=Actinosynnema sp. NPDC023658 TaxID=3155465 RepID=UPI0033E6C864
MPEGLVAALAMDPWALPELLPVDLLDRLGAVVRVEQGVLTAFGTAEARAVLARVGVLVTGWGCPRI